MMIRKFWQNRMSPEHCIE